MTTAPITLQDKIELRLRKWRRAAMGPVKWLAYETGQTRFVPYPDRMYIESTNVCNLSCVMCPTGRNEVERPKGFMDFEVFKQIVDEMAPHVKSTTLHIWGEPLMHKRIFDMIRYCRQNRLRCEISTNATLLTEKKAQQILDAGLDVIYLCLDGMRPETYENVRVNADFERTNTNIRRFIEMKQKGGYRWPFINLQIIQMKQTQDEIEEFIQAWSIPGVDRINVKPFDSWADQIEEISALRPEDGPQVTMERYPCPNLWYHVHIYWDGSLAMCDRDFNSEFPLGNVIDPDGKVRVMKNWNGARMQLLRRIHVEGRAHEVSPCDTCTEWSWWRPTPFQSHGNRPVEEGRSQRMPNNNGHYANGACGSNGNSNGNVAVITLQDVDINDSSRGSSQ